MTNFRIPTHQWLIPIAFGLLGCVLSTGAGAYEVYGPRWYGSWNYRLDQSCPGHIQTKIIERTEIMATLVPIRHLLTTHSTGQLLDQSNQVFCSDDFDQALVYVPRGLNYTVFDIQSETGHTTIGRAHLWWQGARIVEVDIQIDPNLEGWLLEDTIDHEILHGLGCDHSDTEESLMYPFIQFNKGHHFDDFLCLHELYGLRSTLIDYRGNVVIPEARKLGDNDTVWGVFGNVEVLDSGYNIQQ